MTAMSLGGFNPSNLPRPRWCCSLMLENAAGASPRPSGTPLKGLEGSEHARDGSKTLLASAETQSGSDVVALSRANPEGKRGKAVLALKPGGSGFPCCFPPSPSSSPPPHHNIHHGIRQPLKLRGPSSVSSSEHPDVSFVRFGPWAGEQWLREAANAEAHHNIHHHHLDTPAAATKRAADLLTGIKILCCS